MKLAVIFSGGQVEPGYFVDAALREAEVIIAADQGADAAFAFGREPQMVVGDFDSVSQNTRAKLKRKKIPCLRVPRAKDETDTQLAVEKAIEQDATHITILGGVTGNRIDHVIANVFLTLRSDARIRFVNGNQKSLIASGEQIVNIEGKKNDLLSLQAISLQVDGIETQGLTYPLNKESLYAETPRGVSNVFAQEKVSVSFERGILLITHTYV